MNLEKLNSSKEKAIAIVVAVCEGSRTPNSILSQGRATYTKNYIPPVKQCSRSCKFHHTGNICYYEQLVYKFCSGPDWQKSQTRQRMQSSQPRQKMCKLPGQSRREIQRLSDPETKLGSAERGEPDQNPV